MRFNGKAIYNPSGKAAEYSSWACNFYTGCSNDCEYCYCKRGVMSHVWSVYPKLKKCFSSPEHALRVFIEEMFRNIDELRECGILFSFTTDPMLPETHVLTLCAAEAANREGVPVKILTKRADVEIFSKVRKMELSNRGLIAFGFTLTGHDELEQNANTNMERIKAMLYLHKQGFKTFASIEPVIDGPSAFAMINLISGWCDLIKVGLLSGKRNYEPGEIECLYEAIKSDSRGSMFYLKDSIVSYLKLDRTHLPAHCVNQDYNVFKANKL